MRPLQFAILAFGLWMTIASNAEDTACSWDDVKQLRDAKFSQSEVEEICGPIESVDLSFACTYTTRVSGANVQTFASEGQAASYVRKIVETIDLDSDFIVRVGAVPNAMAGVSGTKRLIVYNPQFIQDLNQRSGNEWAAISVLAHEVGHLLNGDFLKGGSKPALELSADKFSGSVLQKLGASMDDSIAAISTFGNTNGSKTHPGTSDRINAITGGWQSSCRKDPGCGRSIATEKNHDVAIQSSVPTPNPYPENLPATTCNTIYGACFMSVAMRRGAKCFCPTPTGPMKGITE